MQTLISRERLRKLVGFGAFGALAGGVYALVLVLLAERAHLALFLASGLAYAAAIPVSYFGNRKVTYQSRNRLSGEAVRFLAAQLVNLVVTSAVVHLATQYFSLSDREGIVTAFVAAPLVSLIMFELWVYRQR